MRDDGASPCDDLGTGGDLAGCGRQRDDPNAYTAFDDEGSNGDCDEGPFPCDGETKRGHWGQFGQLESRGGPYAKENHAPRTQREDLSAPCGRSLFESDDFVAPVQLQLGS